MPNNDRPEMSTQAREWIGHIDSRCRQRVELRLDILVSRGELRPRTVNDVHRQLIASASRPAVGNASEIQRTSITQLSEVTLKDPEGLRAYLEYLASTAHLFPADREELRRLNNPNISRPQPNEPNTTKQGSIDAV